MNGNTQLDQQSCAEIEAMHKLEDMQREAKARLTPERLNAAFAEIRSLNTPPLPGDEMPDLS